MPRPASKLRKARTDDQLQAPPSACRVGDPIVHTGIYRVLHAGHRVSHFVVLLAGQNFPRCARCGDQVEFQLFEATTDLKQDRDFRVHLYEIPHPPPAAGEDDEVA